MTDYELLDPIPPGEMLFEEFMKPLGLSANQVAQDIDVPAGRITEIKTIDECRVMLRDALQEMIFAYRDLGKPIPSETDLIEPLSIEGDHVCQPA